MSRYLKPKVKDRHNSLKSNGRIPQEIPEEAIPRKMMRMRMMMTMMRKMKKCQMNLLLTICLARKMTKWTKKKDNYN